MTLHVEVGERAWNLVLKATTTLPMSRVDVVQVADATADQTRSPPVVDQLPYDPAMESFGPEWVVGQRGAHLFQVSTSATRRSEPACIDGSCSAGKPLRSIRPPNIPMTVARQHR